MLMIAALVSGIPTIAPALCIAADGHVAIESGLSPCGASGVNGMLVRVVGEPYPGCSPSECGTCVDIPLSQMFRAAFSANKVDGLDKLPSAGPAPAMDCTHSELSITSVSPSVCGFSPPPASQNLSGFSILLL